MSITRKELINLRHNEDKECVGFEYELKIENEKGRIVPLSFYFKRLAEKYWEVSMISKNNSFGELRAYSVEYIIPTNKMSLEMVAATGLRNIQALLQAEIQYKSIIDFCIGDTIASML